MNGPLKWHGGKHDLAKRIVALFPPHAHYVEPYFGGGAVLLHRDPDDVSEVVNDLDAALTVFWRVLQDERLFERFKRRVEAVPFSESEFDRSYFVTTVTDPINEQDWLDVAAAFFVHCRQSLAGRMKSFTGITKTRVRRRMNNEVSAWLSAVEGLPQVHERLKRVLIIGPKPAIEVIRKHDTPGTLFYLDPPYLHTTRSTTGEYAHEMSEADHAALLTVIKSVAGKVILSGYPSSLYDSALAGWNTVDIQINNHAASGKTKKVMTERLWMNF